MAGVPKSPPKISDKTVVGSKVAAEISIDDEAEGSTRKNGFVVETRWCWIKGDNEDNVGAKASEDGTRADVAKRMKRHNTSRGVVIFSFCFVFALYCFGNEGGRMQ